MKNFSTKKSLIFFAAWIIFLALFFLWPINSWINSFIRNEEYRAPYIFSFFSLLVLVYLFAEWLVKKRLKPIVVVAAGGFSGLVCGMTSLLLSQALSDNGFENISKSIQTSGFFSFILLYFWISIILGAWLFGVLVSLFSCFVNFDENEKSRRLSH